MSVTKNNIFKLLTSLKLTIFLLSFIAAASILGTVIKQRAGVEEYLAVYSQSTYRIIQFFGFDDTYHSRWFLGAIVLFATNLTFCTLERFGGFLKAKKAAPGLPDERGLSAMQMHFSVATASAGDTIDVLKAGYKTVLQTDEGTMLDKGGIARYGVYIIHTSILIILIGSLVGLIFGYKGFIVLNKGETKDRVTIRGNNEKEMPLGFALKCLDFQVSFYPSGEPKDYVSKLEVIDNGKVVFGKDVRVNNPLGYKGINIYQANYGASNSFFFTIDGKQAVLKERDEYEEKGLRMMVVKYANSVHNFGPGVLLAYMDQGEPKTAWFLTDVERMRERDILGMKIRLDDIKQDFFTGLEVSKDPGVWIVWIGFALILFGLYVNFFTYYRRVYIRKTSNGVIVAGVAYKNREAFKGEFEKLKRRVLS